MEREIIYVGDPMCSWCYGFTKVIQTVREHYKDKVKVTLMMGGLCPDGTHVVDDRYRNFLRGHWLEISHRTGQRFDLSILETTGWIYDTEKPCRAVVTVRHLKPEVEWEYFAAVQKGLYLDNHDPNDPRSFSRIAAGFDIDEHVFLDAYDDEQMIQATREDFSWARSVGVDSFPSVLLKSGSGLSVLTIGYRTLEMLEGPLDTWLGR